MIFRIKYRQDGTFVCRTVTGRKIKGAYERHAHAVRPHAIQLHVFIRDPAGISRFVMTVTPVTGYLDARQIQTLAESLEGTAQAVERGEPPPGEFEQADSFRKSETWRKFLWRNPEFLKDPSYRDDV